MNRRTAAAVILCMHFVVVVAHAAEKAPPSRPGWVGIAFTFHGTWLTVREVTPGSPASRAGVQVRDLIVAVDGRRLTLKTELDVLNFFAALAPGRAVRFTIRRGEVTRQMSVIPARMTDEQYATWKENFELAKQAAAMRR